MIYFDGFSNYVLKNKYFIKYPALDILFWRDLCSDNSSGIHRDAGFAGPSDKPLGTMEALILLCIKF